MTSRDLACRKGRIWVPFLKQQIVEAQIRKEGSSGDFMAPKPRTVRGWGGFVGLQQYATLAAPRCQGSGFSASGHSFSGADRAAVAASGGGHAYPTSRDVAAGRPNA